MKTPQLPEMNPMNATPTFMRLYEAEIARTGSPTRAYGRAVVAFSFLAVLGTTDKVGKGLGFVPATYYRHKAVLRRAGLVPCESPAALAQIACDLGVSDTVTLARLLWSLNTLHLRSLERVLAVFGDFIAESETLIIANLDNNSTPPIVATRGVWSAAGSVTKTRPRSSRGVGSSDSEPGEAA